MDAKAPIRATTQEQIPIEDIIDGIVVLKDGSCCMILAVTALNFSLLSETEQDATIYSYASLLNSLNFPIQIVIRSKRKDISSYLNLLMDEESKQKNPLLQNQIKKYRKFIEEMVKKQNLLDKEFFVVIPFSAIELGVKQAFSSTIFPGFQAKKTFNLSKNYVIEKARMALVPKRDHLVRQFGKFGLDAKQLNTEELITLFYQIYNAEMAEREKITASGQYTSLIIERAPR